MQVEEFLEGSARHHGAKTALVVGDNRLTYADIERRSNRLAWALLAQGVKRGDRVVVHLKNSVDAVISIFAILKAGGVFAVANPAGKADTLAYILANCGASALITHASRIQSIRQCGMPSSVRAVFLAGQRAKNAHVEDAEAVWLEDIEHSGARCAAPPKRCIDVDLAALIYTSGSTGGQKGVMLTHANMVCAADAVIECLENDTDDVVLSCLPLFFNYGLYQVLMTFKFGGTLVLERSLAYPAAVLDRMVKERVTGFPLVPTIAAMLLQMNLQKWDLSNLRYVTNTGGPLPSGHIAEIRRRLPHVKIYAMYGLTECKRVSYLPPEEIDRRPTSVGKAIPNEEVYLVDERGERVGPGAVGELVVRGSNVMKGYWGMPEETDKVLRPGPWPWEKVLYSGDLFKTDEEGFLYFVGRKDDIIKSRGKKVSPAEVEEVLHRLPGVAEAAVVGVPDELLGSAVMAVVVPRQGACLTESEVLQHCGFYLEDFMVPKYVEIRTELPKTATGKVAKRMLVRHAEKSLISAPLISPAPQLDTPVAHRTPPASADAAASVT